MRRVQRTLLLLLTFSANASAHHSHASIDQDRPIALEGTIATTDLMQVECSAESANFFITAKYKDE